MLKLYSREMVHKVNLDQVYFSICETEFLLCSAYKFYSSVFVWSWLIAEVKVLYWK